MAGLARRLVLVLLAAAVWCACASADGWQHLGTVQRFDKLKDGVELFEACLERGLEGVVAKRMDAPYLPGRQPKWRKIKNRAYVRREAIGFGAR